MCGGDVRPPTEKSTTEACLVHALPCRKATQSCYLQQPRTWILGSQKLDGTHNAVFVSLLTRSSTEHLRRRHHVREAQGVVLRTRLSDFIEVPAARVGEARARSELVVGVAGRRGHVP